jgi:hypothetical protein
MYNSNSATTNFLFLFIFFYSKLVELIFFKYLNYKINLIFIKIGTCIQISIKSQFNKFIFVGIVRAKKELCYYLSRHFILKRFYSDDFFLTLK